MFAKLFIVALAVVCASAAIARDDHHGVFPLIQNTGASAAIARDDHHGVLQSIQTTSAPFYSYSPPPPYAAALTAFIPAALTAPIPAALLAPIGPFVTAQKPSSGVPVSTYSTYSRPLAYNAYPTPVVSSPYYYGNTAVVV